MPRVKRGVTARAKHKKARFSPTNPPAPVIRTDCIAPSLSRLRCPLQSHPLQISFVRADRSGSLLSLTNARSFALSSFAFLSPSLCFRAASSKPSEFPRT